MMTCLRNTTLATARRSFKSAGRSASLLASLLAIAGGMSDPAAAEGTAELTAALATVQHEWDNANYAVTEKKARQAAFAALVEHADAVAARYPAQPEALAWQGIVLSTYAGEVGAMSALKYAKRAREALLRAEEAGGGRLKAGVFASLGALYSKVPGGFMGFGDDDLAREYFKKAVAVAPDDIDVNYFYGEFLLDQGQRTAAAAVLRRALRSPTIAERPLFDQGRRSEIRALLAQAEND
jgi:tetratricopeptide (TPR) repeat protein